MLWFEWVIVRTRVVVPAKGSCDRRGSGAFPRRAASLALLLSPVRSFSNPLALSSKMAKKAKTTSLEPNPNGVVNRDVLNRLNFMYQAAVLLSTIVPHPLPSPGNRARTPGSSNTDPLFATQPGRVPAAGMMAVVDELERGQANSEAGKEAASTQERTPVPSTSKMPVQEGLVTKAKRRKRRSGAVEGDSSAVFASRVLVKNMADVAKKATLRM